MIDFRQCFANHQYDSVFDDLIKQAEEIDSIRGEDAYWLAKCIYEASPEEDTDDYVIGSMLHALNTGINASTDKEKFLDAAQMLSRLYIRRNDYNRAINYLMDLSDRMDPVPDWINLYYIMAQILTDNIYRHAEDPVFLYRRLDSVSQDSYVQRAKVYQIFLKRLHDIEESGTDRTLHIDVFEGLKDKYIGTYLDDPDVTTEEDEFEEEEEPEITDTEEEEFQETDVETQCTVAEQTHKDEIDALKKRIAELENASRSKDTVISDLEQKVKDRDSALVRIRTGMYEEPAKEETPVTDEKKLINLRRNEKILLIGDLSVKVKEIIGISKLFGLKEENLEIVSDYEKITNFGNRIIPGKYRAIIIGPTPHKIRDNDGESSLATRILSNPEDYPYAVRCEDERGNLRISKSAYKKSLIYIANMLDVV